ncbi:MATE family efflux transporter [uncultured Ruthenibacterium sp.]|uniref:MATE family efflux transporter n=1 Tax=uncultured Ruthenibacterium sp. TaxID=1905347 RepID=UPI00349EE9CF
MDKEYLIRERPIKALLAFAFPMIVGNLFQQFYTMADSMIVGRFVGEDALAAVGASYSLTTVFISIAIGGGVGASVLTSQHFGARSYQRMRISIDTALVSFLALSLLLAGIGLGFGSQILHLLNTPENIMADAQVYLRIYFLGLPFLFMYNVLSSIFNSLGKSKIPLYLLIFSSVLNIFLDYVLVRFAHLAVAGVAWATLIAQGFSALLSFFILMWQLREYRKSEELVCFEWAELGRMARVALPSILQQSTVSIGMMLVQSVVNGFGSQVLAGYTAASRLESFCIVPMAAMGNAISSYTAQNIGAGRVDRVKSGYRAGYGIVAGFAVLLCLIFEPVPQWFISLFLGEDGTADALRTGTQYLQFICWFYLLIGLKMLTDGLLRGARDMVMFTVANMANLFLRVFVAVVFAPRYGVAMVWIAVPLGWLVNYLISFAQYRTGKWMKKEG